MGQLISGGTNRAVTMRDLESYDRMRQQQAKQAVPTLQSRNNAHEYLFIALFDGTGQDVHDPKQLPTNIGQIHHQLEELKRYPTNRLGHRYVAGIGTQKNPVSRMIDGAVAYTWDERIEEMYTDLARQASLWRDRDAHAQVRLIDVGYSRGAVLVPGLARLVHEYGIVHPKGIKFGRDTHGNLTVTSHRTLIPPGQVAQAVGLFDPVGTNMPRNYDARLPASVISGYSQIARDEQRELFPHQTLLDPDWSDDGRFLSTPVPGGHSNVGGGNRSFRAGKGNTSVQLVVQSVIRAIRVAWVGYGPLATPSVVDFSRPAPDPEQAIEQIQQFDQQQAQIMEQIHTQNAQLSQQGPRR